MPRRDPTRVGVGDHVVLHSLNNEELDGATGRILGVCTNQVDRFIVYIESGRQKTREYRIKHTNVAPAKDRSKIFHDEKTDQTQPGEQEEIQRDDLDDDDDGDQTFRSNWQGAVKVVVTLRGLHKKDEFSYNGRKARLLEKKGQYSTSYL